MNKLICIFLILLFTTKTENVYSNNLIYDVNNIEVKGKINNSFTNKKLIESAFKKAFIVFINKTLLKNDAQNLYKTEIKTIKELVLTYQITENKKNSNDETFLTLNIKFDSKKVNNFIAKKKISYADISNISLTVLPIFIKDKDVFLYEENFFYENWIKSKETKINKSDELIDYNLALENIEDLEYINKNKNNINLINIANIDSFDNIENYVLLIIYFTEDKFKAFIKTSIKNKKIDRNVELNFYPQDTKRSYEEAITILKKEINQIWKEQNLIDINTPSFLDFFLIVNKNNDYLKIKSVLNNIDIIENYSVLEMTNKYTKVRIKYRGKINKIKKKLSEQKINVQIIDNVWKLRIK